MDESAGELMTSDNAAVVGRAIKRRRELLGLRNSDLRDPVTGRAVSPATISDIETGKIRERKAQTWISIFRALGWEPQGALDRLIAGEEPGELTAAVSGEVQALSDRVDALQDDLQSLTQQVELLSQILRERFET
jgi:hypothetical protein